MRLPRFRGVPWLPALSAVTAVALTATAAAALAQPIPGGRPPALEWFSRGSGFAASVALSATMAIGFVRWWIRPTRVTLVRRTGHLRDAMAAAVLALGGAHLLAIAEIARADGRLGPRVVVAGGILAALVALLLVSRRLRSALHRPTWDFVRRAAYVVFVIALVQTAIAGPGFVETALRWLYLATGVAVAGNGIVRIVLGRHREADDPAPGSVPVPNALGEEIGGEPRRVDLVAYLRDSIRFARDIGEHVAVFVVDLAPVVAIEGSPQPAIDRIRSRARRRDFIAIDGVTLILVRRARFAGRDAHVVGEQLLLLARPAGRDGRSPARVGVAAFPKDGWEPALLLKNAVGAVHEAESDGGVAHAEGVIRRAVA